MSCVISSIKTTQLYKTFYYYYTQLIFILKYTFDIVIHTTYLYSWKLKFLKILLYICNKWDLQEVCICYYIMNPQGLLSYIYEATSICLVFYWQKPSIDLKTLGMSQYRNYIICLLFPYSLSTSFYKKHWLLHL